MIDKLIRQVQKMDEWVERNFQPINPYNVNKLKRIDLEPLPLQESRVRRITVKAVVISFAVFVVWAAIAPLDNGVGLDGTLMVQGARKAVQHPSGGVVTAISVKEGEEVKAGQVLIKVNPLTSEASLNSQELDYYVALATESRLIAERTDKSRIDWIPELQQVQSADSRVQEVKRVQEQLFASRREEFRSKLNILNEQISANNATLREMKDIMQVRKSQLETITREYQSNQNLAKEGFVTRAKVSEMEVQRNNAIASVSQLNSDIAKTASQISSARIQLIEAQAGYRKEVEAELSEVQKRRKALKSVVDSLRFDRELAEVKAPVSGTVVGLKVHTEGGVIKSGDILMEIVPEGGKLIVQAKVPPKAIDKVFKGLQADMRFSAFNRATTPIVQGTVTLVGADLVTANFNDPNAANAGFYLAQVETNATGLQKLADLQLQPGMPVEVIVKTGERTFFSLMAKPLTDRFARAFNEVN
ncbi:MAG: HlyD family type I secretion periplasmic adaptor subunit [Limnobacter sp.]|uniref:HlyD family type I secretion periplasmic adaptor subunit n=1 Tax=Limnobacter sp. TaxID=2003368 RepID=UPI00391CDE03